MEPMSMAPAAIAADERRLVRQRNSSAAADPRFIYVARLVCGLVEPCGCGCLPVAAGSYATTIIIHNYSLKAVEVVKRFVPVVLAGAAIAREPRSAGPRAEDRVVIPAQTATMDDCCALVDKFLGGPAEGSHPVVVGLIEITASADVAVSAFYTTRGLKPLGISIAVDRIASR